MNKPRVMVIGDINIDAVLAAKEYPPEGGEAVVDQIDFRLGGSACNTSIVLSKLGVEVLHVGTLGIDPFGKMALDLIQKAGLKTTLIRQDAALQSGFFMIVATPGGQRTMFGGRAANANPPNLEQVLGYLPAIDWLHLSGYTLMNDDQWRTIQQIIVTTHRQGKKISLDPGICTVQTVSSRVKEILPLLDFLIPSQNELKDLMNTIPNVSDHAHLLKSGLKALVIKLGGQGSKYIDQGQELVQPAFPIEQNKVHDTTGAGDCFNAGFIYAILKGAEIKHALMLGNLAAYRLVTAQHGMADIGRSADLKGDLSDAYHLIPGQQAGCLDHLLNID
jgi:ribokinase